jgi:hypothetical protein
VPHGRRAAWPACRAAGVPRGWLFHRHRRPTPQPYDQGAAGGQCAPPPRSRPRRRRSSAPHPTTVPHRDRPCQPVDPPSDLRGNWPPERSPRTRSRPDCVTLRSRSTVLDLLRRRAATEQGQGAGRLGPRPAEELRCRYASARSTAARLASAAAVNAPCHPQDLAHPDQAALLPGIPIAQAIPALEATGTSRYPG